MRATFVRLLISWFRRSSTLVVRRRFLCGAVVTFVKERPRYLQKILNVTSAKVYHYHQEVFQEVGYEVAYAGSTLGVMGQTSG